MKSIFRIYAKTSKGNDNYLLKELHSLKITPKYDQHLNAFFFNSTWPTLMDISFRCLSVQQMYVQIGQKFKIIDEQQIASELERLPFKNFVPMQRGLVENTTLKVLVRESVHIPSENVLVTMVTSNFMKEIVKKEYYKEIEGDRKRGREAIERQEERGLLGAYSDSKRERKNHTSYFDIKDAVERKWWQEDETKQTERKNHILHLEKQLEQLQQNHKKLLLSQHNTPTSNNTSLTMPSLQQTDSLIASTKQQLTSLQQFSQQTLLSEQLAYHPHLVFYIRKNQGRFLLKINKDNLYKHGWKNQVNWGPIRESIAASIIHQSRVVGELNERDGKGENQKEEVIEKRKIKIWDPMCGSGTFGLVAATMLDQIPVRSNAEKLFEWMNWPVFKKQYLEQYWKQKETEKNSKNIDYQLILSDKDRQTINYSIDNFRLLVDGAKEHFSQSSSKEKQGELFPSKTPLSEVMELVPGKVGFACGDFEQVMELLKNPKNSPGDQPVTPITIITNLPYIHSRSQEKHPLNQLTSIYSRFSQMIKQNSSIIDNVFVIVDKNVMSRNHFLNISQQRWSLIGQYNSGGMEIGLYAWSENKIKPKFDEENSSIMANGGNALVEYEKLRGEISSQDRQLILKKEKTISKALIEYRKKLSQIDRKYYNLPKHLVRTAKGYQKIVQKRRKRHLQSAYELFARKRDKLIALKQYAHQKLEVKMLKRGTVWKNKNLRFFNHSQEKLSEYGQEIKQIFQKKIEEALKREEDYQEKKKLKSGDKVEIAKIRNKWNADEKKMVKQIKYSKGGSQTARGRYSASKSKNSSGRDFKK